ncbi:MAG: M20/M25/M40 family metallo-hydrolase [bacterium]|nr:M20/M25/M40 family metallo-hydrolase [bacterium]
MKRAFLGSGAILLILACIVVVRALTSASGPTKDTASASLFDERSSAEAVERFAASLRIETISHSRDSGIARDDAAFVAFREFLAQSYPAVHSTLEREIVGDHGLLFRWGGANDDLDPALLMGHFDVVPIDPATLEGWTHPPFAGTMDAGYVWGRGALDDKLSVIGPLEAAELLIAAGFRPTRTLYLWCGADEELGGLEGAAVVAKRFRDAGQRLAFVIDEGGVVISGLIPGMKRPMVAVGVAEKGSVSVELIVESEGGHSSMPTGDSTIGILAAAIGRLEQNPMPAHFEGHLSATFDAVTPHVSFPARLVLANRWLFSWPIQAVLSRRDQLSAMMRTTTAPTIFQSGVKQNVLPTHARAIVNFRIFPGDTSESVIEHVRRIVDDDRVAIGSLGMRTEPSPVSELDGPAGHIFSEAIRRSYGDVPIAPILIPGGTDARYFRDLSDGVFGFNGAHVGTEDIRRAHGIDERIRLDGLATTFDFYAKLLQSLGEGNDAR